MPRTQSASRGVPSRAHPYAAPGVLGSIVDPLEGPHRELAAQVAAMNEVVSAMTSDLMTRPSGELGSTVQNHRSRIQQMARNIRAQGNLIRTQAHAERDRVLAQAHQAREQAHVQERNAHEQRERARNQTQNMTQRQRAQRAAAAQARVPRRNEARRPVVRELSAAARSLPSQSYTQEQKDAGGSEHQCRICLEHFALSDQVKTLPCFHLFHSNCVDRWLRVNERCPVCRTNLDGSAPSPSADS
eukprot:GEMP01057043.1.p1 GENE.GEMP01057043.1~~GEMP01057043.1.p1  ORF type:complete len:244 (+),score=68.19 GEMP01057043.1:205-936(+)